MREWEIGAVENIHGALPYIRFAPILALVGVGLNRIGKEQTNRKALPMSTSCLLSEYKMASGVSGPHSDPHAAVSDFAEVANIIDQAKRLSLFWGQNGGGGSPIQSLENLGVYRTRFLGHKFVSCGGPE